MARQHHNGHKRRHGKNRETVRRRMTELVQACY